MVGTKGSGMNVAQEVRWKIESSRRDGYGRLPASRAFRDALIDQPLDAVELHASNDGADVDGLVERRTNWQSVHAVLNFTDQCIRDALLHQQARPSAANLSLVEPDAVDQAFHGAVQVGIFKNNERGLAAKFKRELLVALRRSLSYRASHFRRARESNLVDVGMFHKRFACRIISGDDVYDSGGEASLLADLRESERRQRCKLGGFQHNSISGGEGGSNLPPQHQQRKLPRNDFAYNAASG